MRERKWGFTWASEPPPVLSYAKVHERYFNRYGYLNIRFCIAVYMARCALFKVNDTQYAHITLFEYFTEKYGRYKLATLEFHCGKSF